MRTGYETIPIYLKPISIAFLNFAGK